MRFFFSVFVILFITTESQWNIDLEPSKSLHSLFEEDDLTLSCNVVGCNTTFDFRWYKDNVEIHFNETSYAITNLSRKDNGIYKCSVRCGEKSNYTDSNLITIDLQYGPTGILLDYNMTDILIEGKSSLHLNCQVECKPACSISWTRDGKELSDNFNRSTIYLPKIWRNNSGSYQCSAGGVGGQHIKSNKVHVNVSYGELGLYYFTNGKPLVHKNSSLNMSCVVHCVPRCDIQWWKDGNRLWKFNNRKSLTFSPLTKNKAGIYHCEIKGVFGDRKSNEVEVKVFYGPLSKPTLENWKIRPTENESVYFNCNTECNPSCVYTWSKNGKEVGLKSKHIAVRRRDSGKYYCTASNRFGNKTSKLKRMIVQYSPNKVEVRPDSATFYAKYGTKPSQNISCNADCEPACVFDWARKYIWVRRNQYRYFQSGATLFESRKLYYSSVFVCRARNKVGSLQSRPIAVYVRNGPTDIQITQSAVPWENSTVLLNCSAECVPVCTFRWKFKQNLLSQNSNLLLTNLTSKDSGSYFCIVKDDYGEKEEITHLNVLYSPNKVEVRPDTTTFYAKYGTKPSQNISCNADCEPACVFDWARKYIWVRRNQYRSFQSGATLFESRKLYYSSVFVCRARNKVGSLQSRPIAVYVRNGPTDIQITRSAVPWENSRMLLNCSAECVLVCRFKWIFKQNIISQNSSLLFTRLTSKNSGFYFCIVKDDYGEKQKFTDLNVFYSPRNVKIKPTIRNINDLKEGKYLQMKCEADCNPHCQYFKWCFNGNCFPWNSNYYSIRRVTSTNSGKYLCSASNNEQLYVNSSNKVAIDVKYKPYIQEFMAKRKNLISPDSLVLQFRVISNPPSNVTILNYRHYRIYFQLNVFGNSSYEKQTTNCSDTGYYYLIARNPIGYNMSSIFVNVSCPPIIIRSDISSSINKVGDHLSIKVTYDGNPLPTVKWFFNKWDLNITSLVQPSIVTQSKNVSLISIKALSENDYGTYLICLKNKYGEVNKSFEVKGPPLPASDINIECSREATIYWKAGFSGGVHQTFVILYSTERSWNYYEEYLVSTDEENEGEQKKVLLSNLAIDSYYFKIIATNKFGNGSSEVFNCTLKDNEDLSAGKFSAATEFAIGAAVLLIIIIIVVGLIVSVKVSKQRKKETKQDYDNDIHDTGTGLRENELYISADNVELPLAQSVSNQGVTNCTYALVMPSHKATKTTNAEYAEVVKKKSKAKESNDVYATVVKKNTREFEIKQSVSVKEKPKIPKKPSVGKVNGKKKNVNKEGLLYVELDLKEPDCNERGQYVVHGSENKTDYADIDFTLRADPLPDSDDDDEPEGSINT